MRPRQGVRTQGRGINERGVALVIAVFVLTIIGALVAAAFFAAVQEHRMSDATRRHHRAMAAAESKLSEVLRQWPDDGGNLPLYPHDSLVLQRGSVVLRRLAADIYLAAVPEQALGMLIFRAGPCVTARADGVEMAQAKCYTDSMLQKMAVPTKLGSRGLVHLF